MPVFSTESDFLRYVDRTLKEKFTPVSDSVGTWKETVLYVKGAVVVKGTSLYVSIRDDNMGNDPTASEGWWSPIQAGRGGSTVLSTTMTFGSSTKTEYTIHHGLGSRDLIWSIRDATSGEYILPKKFTAVDEDSVKIELNLAPGVNNAILMVGTSNPSHSPPLAKVAKGESVLFGNETDTSYMVVHSLSSQYVIPTVRSQSGEYLTPSISVLSDAMLRITLRSPPGVDGAVLTLASCPDPPPEDDVDVIEVTEPSAEWVYENHTGKAVFVQMFDAEGHEIIGDITQDFNDEFSTVKVKYEVGER